MTIVETRSDATIFEAWDAFRTAYRRLCALPVESPKERYGADGFTDDERAEYEAMDAAEAIVTEAVATTIRGAEIQLWMSLARSLDRRDSLAFVHMEDAAALSHPQCECETGHLVVLSAIRSLRTINRRAAA